MTVMRKEWRRKDPNENPAVEAVFRKGILEERIKREKINANHQKGSEF